MTVWVLVNAYQEAKNLPRMWRAAQRVLAPRPAKLVVVDGKYPDYEGKTNYSTDGTRDFAADHGHLVSLADYECEKRTAGLRRIDTFAADGDWILVLDADEELTEIFSWPTRVGYISFTRNSGIVTTYGRCRLYRWEPGLTFKHRHYDLYDRNGELVASLEDAPEYDTVGSGIHHSGSHSPERVKQKTAYYIKLREREGHPSEVPA